MPSEPAARRLESLLTDGGVATRADIESAIGRARLRGALRERRVTRILPNTYVAETAAHHYLTRCRSAIAWAPHGSVLAGLSALFVHGLTEPHEPGDVWIRMPRDTSARSPRWVHVLRPERERRDCTARGLPASAVPDAILESWNASPRDARVGLLADSLRRSKHDASDVAAALARWPRISERRRLVTTLRRCADGAESYLEIIARERVFTGARLRRLVAQHGLEVHGERFRVDLWDAETATAIELDGASHHSGARNAGADRRRDSTLASVGVLTLRFTYRDIVDRPQWCREVTLRVLSERAGRPRRH